MGFEYPFSYARFIPEAGPSGCVSDAEAAYLGGLIRHAEDRGKLPVLTATRSLGRVGGLKRALPGFHILLYRNLFHQWCSYTDQSCKGNPYFIDKLREAIEENQHDATFRIIKSLYPITMATHTDENNFFSFVFLHLYTYTHAAAACDLLMDVNRVARESGYRTDIERQIATQDVHLSLTDARETLSLSFCPVDQMASTLDQLGIIGEIVLDQAPSVAGREFGRFVLGELIESIKAYNFNASGLRTFLIKTRQEASVATALAASAQQAAMAERDTTIADLRGMQEQLSALLFDHERLRNEFEAQSAASNHVVAEHRVLQLRFDALSQEADQLRAAYGAQCIAGELALEEQTTLKANLNAASADIEKLQAAFEAKKAERDLIERDRDSLHKQLQSEKDNLLARLNALTGTIESFQSEVLARETARACIETLVKEQQDLRAAYDDKAAAYEKAIADRTALQVNLDETSNKYRELLAQRESSLRGKIARLLIRNIS